jgi:hypothetical protein
MTEDYVGRALAAVEAAAAAKSAPARSQIGVASRRSPGTQTIVQMPVRAAVSSPGAEIKLEDFYAYLPMHLYIYAPTREMWPAISVNSQIPPIPSNDPEGKPTPANQWLDKHRPVQQLTWAPGEPELITGRHISDGGWFDRSGARVFNLYKPPTIRPGDANLAGPWLDHVRRVYPDDADHLIKWLAQRVQRPDIKINHALVLGGMQGVGKDTLLEPVKHAVGPWNCSEVSPQQMLGRFNGFVKSVILRVSEARDLGDVDRFAFYDHTKVYTAAPPDVLRVDEKHLREHSVLNCTGMVITTNHKADGIYLPADDRRHYIAWTELGKEDFPADYFPALWGWYDAGGIAHAGAYLRALDISSFDPKAPPPKTRAFWDIVAANHAPENGDLADALELLGNPPAVTIDKILTVASADFGEYLRDRKNRRQIPHRFEECEYVPVRNDAAKDGFWVIRGQRRPVYAKRHLSLRDQIAAARKLT